MDILDKKYEIKKFFKTIYREIEPAEYIRVFQNNKDDTYKKVTFYNDIDEIVNYCSSKYNYGCNTYFELATTDGVKGAEVNLKYRYCLGFDFDKKDLGSAFNHKDIVNRFIDLKIYCHCIVDSGNGYHAYIMINKTNDFNKVNEVQKVLCEKLGADKKAIKPTQVLRVPFTYNVKNQPKEVKIVHLADRNDDKFKPYDIEFLYKKNCNKVLADDKKIRFTLSNTNIPKCIETVLKNGSVDGDRYKDLCNIVVALRLRNKTLSDIKEVCKEWALKSDYDDNLIYRIEHIYNNKHSLELNCKECSEFNNCYNKVVSDFVYSDDDKIITISETHMSKLKSSNRKGAKLMKSNDLLVYGVLKLHSDGLTRDEILQELTYTKKKKVINVALGEKTLRTALKSLIENGFVEVIKGNARQGIKDLYIVKESKSKVELTYNISYSATYECVKGNITSEELRLYNYMRYLHHKEQRENPSALKGNLFQVNQTVLAKELGVTQGRISQMLENLIDEKLVGIWYRQPSKNNGFEYNIYRLIY